MATKEFTSKVAKPRDYAQELNAVIEKNFPLEVTSNAMGQLLSVKYETTWKEGGTIPVEQKDGSIEYEEDYKIIKLTDDEVKKINAWIDENLAG